MATLQATGATRGAMSAPGSTGSMLVHAHSAPAITQNHQVCISSRVTMSHNPQQNNLRNANSPILQCIYPKQDTPYSIQGAFTASSQENQN